MMYHMDCVSLDLSDVIVNDIGVDVKCKIMLANHNKSQQFIVFSDVIRGS